MQKLKEVKEQIGDSGSDSEDIDGYIAGSLVPKIVVEEKKD